MVVVAAEDSPVAAASWPAVFGLKQPVETPQIGAIEPHALSDDVIESVTTALKRLGGRADAGDQRLTSSRARIIILFWRYHAI